MYARFVLIFNTSQLAIFKKMLAKIFLNRILSRHHSHRQEWMPAETPKTKFSEFRALKKIWKFGRNFGLWSAFCRKMMKNRYWKEIAEHPQIFFMNFFFNVGAAINTRNETPPARSHGCNFFWLWNNLVNTLLYDKM